MLSENMKSLLRFVQHLVFEFISAICVENVYFIQACIHAGKCFTYQDSIFVLSSTLSYDFPVKQINEYADVVPAVSNPYIGQIADYHVVLRLAGKRSVHYVLHLGFTVLIHMRLVLCYGIGRYQPLLFHHASAGCDISFFVKLHFDFPGTIIIPALSECLLDLSCQIILCWFLLCFVIIRTSWNV